jgi:hypothetical protein
LRTLAFLQHWSFPLGRIGIDNTSVDSYPADSSTEAHSLPVETTDLEKLNNQPTLVETWKFKGVDPLSCMTSTLSAILNGHTPSRLDELLPWSAQLRWARPVF